MTEGLARHFRSDRLEPFSAGLEKQTVDPLAIRVMAEIGIDISHYRSKTIGELGGREFDYVVTVCDRARERCPYFPARQKVVHRGFDDPPRFAESASSEEEALGHYRRVRDEIKDFVLTLPEGFEADSQG